MPAGKRKTLKEVLKEVDPNLNIIPSHRSHRRKTTNADWGKAAGEKCPTCGKETLRLFGDLKQCKQCFYKEKGWTFDETTCEKCEERAVKVTALSFGVTEIKIICPKCGTYAI